MGSAPPVTDVVVTKLPRFNTGDYAQNRPFCYHIANENAVPIDSNSSSQVDRFAQFVVALTGAESVSFLVQEANTLPALYCADQEHRTTVHPVQAYTHPEQAADLGFGLYLCAEGDEDRSQLVTRLSQPLVLAVSSPRSNAATSKLSIFLRSDYGPLVAAQSLLRSAISYMCSENRGKPLPISHLQTNSPPAKSDGPTLLHDILRRSASQCPDNIAFDELSSSHAHRVMTYAEARNLASTWANQIDLIMDSLSWPAFHGEQRLFPILLPNCIELSICWNGILESGHSFCMLHMDTPEARLKDILEDLNCPGIIGIGPNPWAGTAFGKSIVWIDFLDPLASVADRSEHAGLFPSRRVVAPDDLAYVSFTSGSTGIPKAVMVPHRAAMAYIYAVDFMPTGPQTRWMVMSPPTFDIFMPNYFMPLYQKGTVCIAPADLLVSNPEQVLNDLRATGAFVVASLAMLLRPERLPALATLCVGGELVGQRIVDNFASQEGDEQSGRRLVMIYGPAECTCSVVAHDINKSSRPSVLGPPLPGTQFLVVEPGTNSLRPVPLGVAGELAVGGSLVTLGYHNRPKQSAFMEDPTYGRIYRTGDKVRVVWSERGEAMIEFLGRISSDQVKLNGRRVELPEIEAVLCRATGVAQAVVTVSRLHLVAGIRPNYEDHDKAFVEASCRAEAKRYLPPWMQPSRYFVMEKLPTGPNGKIDRKALSSLSTQMDEIPTSDSDNRSTGENVTPKTHSLTGSQVKESVEPAVTGIVYAALAEALGEFVLKKDLTTKLVDLGLDSLRALIVLQCLEDSRFDQLEIQDVLSAGTIGGLISELDRKPLVNSKDTEPMVYEILAEVLGDFVRQKEKSCEIASLGIDSLRALLLLQMLDEFGVTELDIGHVLSAGTIGGLIGIVDQLTARVNGKAGSANGQHAPASISEAVAVEAPRHTHIDGIDVSKIPLDDEESIFGLSVEAKIAHFEHHCRALCVKSLGLSDVDVEQVLPTTNVQTRFIAPAVDPEFCDKKRWTGIPHVTHFPYNVPIDMDPARLQRAVEAVLPRYDCFRTVFVPVAHPLAPFAQCILSPTLAKVPKVEIVCDDTDASADDSLWRETIYAAQRAVEACMTIDRPGVAVTWVWSPNRARCVFNLTLTHAIYDGTQLLYLFDAVMAEYASPGSPPPLEFRPMRTAVELNLSYDWVKTVTFWAGRLGGVPGCRLGSRRPEPLSELSGSWAGAEETHMRSLCVKSRMTMRQLDRAATQMSTTPLAVAEAAWCSVLAQTLSEEAHTAAIAGAKPLDVQFGTVLNGRRSRDALRCMAPMLAAMPMRLLVDGRKQLTNQETCALLSAQRNEAEPYLQLPCPDMAHARLGHERFDTLLLLQTFQPQGERNPIRGLPGFNFDENMFAPYKECDAGFPMYTELYPGSQRWDEKMLIRCTYSIARHDFLTREWVLGALSAFDEALLRITSEPSSPFYVG